MRKAIVYASVHHGNTEKLVKRIAEECQVDLIDAVKQPDADLSSYDMIGFASGIYFSKFHQSIIGICREKPTGRQKGISDLYLWWKCEL
ncbi:MAG: flavodoxin domain-containing protein [Ruminococcus sp.]